MLDYNKDKKLFLVKRVFVPNKLLEHRTGPLTGGGSSGGESDSPSEGSDTENTANRGQQSTESSDDIHYWVPRVRLMFAAENPIVFADRVSSAYQLREKTEALLRYCTQTYM